MSALHAVDPPVIQASIALESITGRPTLTVPEAAALLGIGRNACYEAIGRGEVPSLRFGARIVVPTAPLLRLLGITGA